MSMPKQAEQIQENRQAIAPYNFVPLPEALRLAEKPPSQGFYDDALLTGKITCTLVNETPMYVRAAQTVDEYDAKTQSSEPFYHGSPAEKLLIPGSSLRGMLRTLVEVVSQARIAPVTDKQLFYRSVEDTAMGETYRERMKDKVRAGFYHEDKSGASITPTIACRVSREDILATFGGDSLYLNEKPASPKRTPRTDMQHNLVFVQISEQASETPTRFYQAEVFTRQKTEGLDEGQLVITGDMQNKKNEFVFLKQAVASKIKLTDEQIYLFEDRDQLTQYQKNAFKNGKRGAGKLKDGEPVFYLVGEHEQEILGFGRAYMFRLPYKLSPAEMLPDALLGNPEQYDMAESLFGYVPANKLGRKAVAGRIFIADAILQGDAKAALLPSMQLKLLSSPKATSFQHYLTQEKPDYAKKLFHYDSPKTQTTLRGHKFYWHKGMLETSDFEANAQDLHDHESQYSPPVKPIKENQRFQFDIRFENLRPEELGALLWVLDKAKDENYRLKIGMGKPYGLGAVSICASVNLEKRLERYQSLFAEKMWSMALDENSPSICDEARLAFARWVLRKQNATIDDVDTQERIQELLIMLSWKEPPAKGETRYMDLKEFVGKQGKYTSKRPVLPMPHTIFGKWLKVPEPKVYTPSNLPPEKLVPGDIILATTTGVEGKDGPDYILTCKQFEEDDLCYVRKDKRRLSGDYILDLKDNKVYLEVLAVKKEYGAWVVECQTVKQ